MLKSQKRVFSEVFRVSACPWAGSRALGFLARFNFIFNYLSISLNPRKEHSITMHNTKKNVRLDFFTKFWQHAPNIASLTQFEGDDNTFCTDRKDA